MTKKIQIDNIKSNIEPFIINKTIIFNTLEKAKLMLNETSAKSAQYFLEKELEHKLTTNPLPYLAQINNNKKKKSSKKKEEQQILKTDTAARTLAAKIVDVLSNPEIDICKISPETSYVPSRIRTLELLDTNKEMLESKKTELIKEMPKIKPKEFYIPFKR